MFSWPAGASATSHRRTAGESRACNLAEGRSLARRLTERRSLRLPRRADCAFPSRRRPGSAGRNPPASLRGTISTTFAQLARKTRYPGIWRAGRRGGRLREASRRGRVAGRGRRSPLVSYRPPITSQQVLIYHHKASWFVGALVLRLLVVRHNGLARPLSWCFSPLVYVPRECCTK